MDADPLQPGHYQSQLRSLIESVEACLERAEGEDRECRLQRTAFIERCERASDLTQRLLAAGGSERSMLEGDALRCLEALRLSRAFFEQRAHASD